MFFQLPHGLLAVSLMTTFQPDLARAAVRGDWPALQRAPAARAPAARRLVVVPAAIGYLVLALAVGWCRGRRAASWSTARPCRVTAASSAGFALGLIGFSVYLFVLRGFYALQDTRTPFLINCVENASTSSWPSCSSDRSAWSGLAVAYAIAYTVAAVVALAVLIAAPGLRPGRVAAVAGHWWSLAARRDGAPRVGWRSSALLPTADGDPIAVVCAAVGDRRSAWSPTRGRRSSLCGRRPARCGPRRWPPASRRVTDAERRRLRAHDQVLQARAGTYLTAGANQKFNEKADPKIQLEQAIIEAQDQHRRLKEQAANVIAQQKQAEMRLNRSHRGARAAQRQRPPGRPHGRRGHQGRRHRQGRPSTRRRPSPSPTGSSPLEKRGRGPQGAWPCRRTQAVRPGQGRGRPERPAPPAASWPSARSSSASSSRRRCRSR